MLLLLEEAHNIVLNKSTASKARQSGVELMDDVIVSDWCHNGCDLMSSVCYWQMLSAMERGHIRGERDRDYWWKREPFALAFLWEWYHRTCSLFFYSVFQCCCAFYSFPLSCDTVPLCLHMLWNSDQNLCQVKQLMSQDKQAYQKQLNHFLIG